LNLMIFPVDIPMALSFVTALVMTWVLIPPIVRLSHTKHFVALPNGRTSHAGAIPTIGGVTLYASFIIAGGLFMPNEYPAEFQYLMVSMVVLFLIGLQDDLAGINPRKKMAGQIVASLIMIIAADVRMTTLHGLFGIGEIPYLASVLITLFVFIGLINAYNLIDGIDGLASGLGITSAIVFGIWLSLLGSQHYAILSFTLAGALIAFFRFNVFSKKNKLFMGDTGSMFIGFIFAISAVKLLCCPIPADSYLYMKAYPVVVMSLMIIPIADTLRVMTMRIMKGRAPFYADRTHLHHDLLSLGLSHLHASVIIVIANLSLFFMALLLKNLPILLLGFVVLTSGIIVCSIPLVLSRIGLKRPVSSPVHLTVSE
jgi:UDP-GlcNAc:undecaprenyl-phosphate/decaprenyl-phosphate GlcNAc-1-phosphate transferase